MAVVLSVAVLMAAVHAPLVHAHVDEHATDHHATRVVHSHVAPHVSAPRGSNGAAVEDGEAEQALFIQLFAAVKAAAFLGGARPATAFELAVPLETHAHRPVDVARGHDPPSQRSLPSRAPPTFAA